MKEIEHQFHQFFFSVFRAFVAFSTILFTLPEFLFVLDGKVHWIEELMLRVGTFFENWEEIANH